MKCVVSEGLLGTVPNNTAVYNYAGKADLSKGCWKPKENWG